MADQFPRRLRGTLWPRVLVQLAPLQLLLLGCVGLAVWDRLAPGRPAGMTPAAALAVGAGVGTLASLVVALVGWRLLTVRVGPAGLRTLGGRVVPWDAPMEVRPVRWVGIWYLELKAAELVLPVRVPADLTDPEGAAEAVAGYAGDDHPLAVALHDRLAGD